QRRHRRADHRAGPVHGLVAVVPADNRRPERARRVHRRARERPRRQHARARHGPDHQRAQRRRRGPLPAAEASTPRVAGDVHRVHHHEREHPLQDPRPEPVILPGRRRCSGGRGRRTWSRASETPSRRWRSGR
ncbi:Os04g0550833, partial [Oryza sativa Japonica Group]